MDDLLFLCHRIPYPPDKGEKIRAWHMLRHLGQRWRVHLGCFVDDPADAGHEAALRAHCADVLCLPIDRSWRRLRALAQARPGVPLTAGYFEDARLARWVAGKRQAGIEAAFVYCSAMAPYVWRAPGWRRRVLDMVDVDSEKWRLYAERTAGPARLIWAREARTLLRLERRAAARFDRTLLVSEAEADRLAELAPESRARIGWIDNGVDLDHFAPARFESPYASGDDPAIAFVGTMDYRPNIDAATWFAREALPAIRAAIPGARFVVVGSNPTAEVVRLGELAGVRVTGRVADVRPYLAHAGVVVAPLRIARGIQNKVLEAMAMACPVVASPEAFEGIDAQPGRDLLLADGAPAFSARVVEILRGGHPGLGSAARAAMQRRYAWPSVLDRLDALLRPAADPATARQTPALVA